MLCSKSVLISKVKIGTRPFNEIDFSKSNTICTVLFWQTNLKPLRKAGAISCCLVISSISEVGISRTVQSSGGVTIRAKNNYIIMQYLQTEDQSSFFILHLSPFSWSQGWKVHFRFCHNLHDDVSQLQSGKQLLKCFLSVEAVKYNANVSNHKKSIFVVCQRLLDTSSQKGEKLVCFPCKTLYFLPSELVPI